MKIFFESYINNCIAKLTSYYDFVQKQSLPDVVPKNTILEFISQLLYEIKNFQDQEGLLEEEFIPRNIRAFRTLLLKVNQLEYYALPIITHYNKEYDSYFNRIIKTINIEIGSPVAPPYICSLSNARDYFWYESTFSTIFIPAIEKYSLLNLPDLFHELAHHILKEYKSNFKEKEDEWFSKYNMVLEQKMAASDISDSNTLARSHMIFSAYWPDFWSEELICDLIACFCCGKSFAWTHLKICHLKKTDVEGIDIKNEVYEYSETHPPDAYRITAMFCMLDYLNINCDDIRQAWESYTECIDNNKPPLYDLYFPQALIFVYVKHVAAICDVIGLYPCTKNHKIETSTVYKLNQAWELFRTSQEELKLYEKEFQIAFEGNRSSK